MSTPIIDIYTLHEHSYLSPVRCQNFSEAAAVCLSQHHSANLVPLTVIGDLEGEFLLHYEQASQEIADSRTDLVEAAEDGGVCLALLVVEYLTGEKVVRQAVRQTGVDYFLGKKEQQQIFYQSRLEVSGILQGTKNLIRQRMKEK